MHNNSKSFMINYFWGNEVYSADYIDKKEKPEIVKHCRDEEKYIVEEVLNGKRVYRLTARGKEYLG